MIGVQHDVRGAVPAQTDAIATVLRRAFVHDPFVHWVLDRRAVQHRAVLRFFRWWTGQLIDQDVTWTVGLGHGGTSSVPGGGVRMPTALGGAAVWALPGQWQPSAAAQARLVASLAPSVRHPARVVRALLQLEHDHPAEPHLYLALLGVDPVLQGTGAGSTLIAAGLELADEERWPAYLESSNPRNVNFYARHGFATVGELALPAGGPVITRMWREPR